MSASSDNVTDLVENDRDVSNHDMLEADNGRPEWLSLILADKSGFTGAVNSRLPEDFDHFEEVRQGFLYALFNAGKAVIDSLPDSASVDRANIKAFFNTGMAICKGPTTFKRTDDAVAKLHSAVWTQHRKMNRKPITNRYDIIDIFVTMVLARGLGLPSNTYKAMTALAGAEAALEFPFADGEDLLLQLRKPAWSAEIENRTNKHMLLLETVVENVVRDGRFPGPA